MLRHLGLLGGCFDGRFLLRWRPSSVVPLRSTHNAPNCGDRRLEASDSPPAAAKDPGWVILNKYGIRTDDDDSSVAVDARTVAYSCTSSGHHLRVSFARAPPPASSFICYDFPDTSPDGDDDDDDDDEAAEDVEESEEDEDHVEESEEEDDVNEWRISVVSAHGDCILLKMSHRRCPSYFEDEHFLYRAGPTGRPPSLSLLPDRDFLTKSEQGYASKVSPPIRPIVCSGTTSLLRRGNDDVLIVQLDLMYDRGLRQSLAEFCLLRHGAPQWELKEPVPIVHDDEGGRADADLWSWRCTTTVIPLGDRFLCWVKYEKGFLLCDIADEASPRVRYVPLPPGVCWDPKVYEDDRSQHCKNMGAVGASALRFVSVDPHCCCGGSGRSTCLRSRYAFTINTWMMKVSMDEPMVWVKDGEIDCEEIWEQPGYEGLPRADFQCPVVCLEDPSVVCFLVSNTDFVSSYEDRKEWMVQLNIKTKTLLSAVQFTKGRCEAYHHLPLKLEC